MNALRVNARGTRNALCEHTNGGLCTTSCDVSRGRVRAYARRDCGQDVRQLLRRVLLADALRLLCMCDVHILRAALQQPSGCVRRSQQHEGGGVRVPRLVPSQELCLVQVLRVLLLRGRLIDQAPAAAADCRADARHRGFSSAASAAAIRGIASATRRHLVLLAPGRRCEREGMPGLVPAVQALCILQVSGVPNVRPRATGAATTATGVDGTA